MPSLKVPDAIWSEMSTLERLAASRPPPIKVNEPVAIIDVVNAVDGFVEK
jgi:hypothetical protein